jgi:hypothetical protein
MNPSDVLGHPRQWKPVPRAEALRECAFKTVLVLARGPGGSHVSPFNRGSRYFNAGGPYNYSGLQYFLKITESTRPRGRGNAPKSPPPQPTDKQQDPETEPETAAQEPAKKPPEIKITKLDCDQFVPLVDTVLIHYEITGDVAQAQAVHLRIATEKAPDKFILDKKLEGAPAAKGIFMWDGGVTDAAYAGCVNLAGSPYLVQLGLAGKGEAPKFTNKAPIKVELLQTELTVGDGFGLGEDEKNQHAVDALKEELKKTPGKGRIHMPGSFFKINSDEMYSSASYTVYSDKLKKGVPIPLFVKLWLKDKSGGKKHSPQAVAGTRILWDAMPDDEAQLDANLSDRGVNETAKKFMKKIGVYKQAKTEPPGATAQWEIGGIRADVPARKGREQWKNLDDPWKADAPPAKRTWAGLSKCGKSDLALADSGMLYYNGRIAGDRYHVSAYVDLDGSLDDKDPKLNGIVPASRKTQTLELQNWRDVNLSKGYRIGAGTEALAFDEANAEFKKAGLSILPKPGMVPEEIQVRWKSEYKDVVIILSGRSFIKDAAEQDPGLYPTAFISYNAYWEKSNPDTGFFGKVWHRIKAFFGAADEDEYIKKCNDAAYPLYTETAKAFPAGADGLTYFKFGKDGEHNRHGSSYTAGIAPAVPGYSARNKAVLFVFDEGQAAKTVIHEMGHNLFLPHAPGHWEAGQNPAGAKPGQHDKAQVCLMSYHPDKKYFCGLCFLRMGGWDHTSIKNDGTVIDAFELE